MFTYLLNLVPKHARKREAYPPWVKDSNDCGFIPAGSMVSYKTNV